MGEEKVQAGEGGKGFVDPSLESFLFVYLDTKSCANGCLLAARVEWEGKAVEWETWRDGDCWEERENDGKGQSKLAGLRHL